jgi:inorganic pyrophosphatase
MGLENIPSGKQIPEDVNVIIEIPSHASPVKYEVDKRSGMVTVDRFLATAMFYPCEYGFIPHTLSEDGDPVDVLVVSPFSLISGAVIRCRPIGLLRMTDESGKDAKILAVPIDKITPHYRHILKPQDIGKDIIDKIEHFFTHYKDLETDKWVKIDGWEDVKSAKDEIVAGVLRYQKEKGEA